MKNYYDLLAIERTASADDVKRAFRREIARYHPDKVQHLGPEFQEIAATRAAELTEAYRILMDVGLRQSYDEALDEGTPAPFPQQPAPTREPAPPSRPVSAEPTPEDSRDTRFQQERATTIEFLRRAVLAKFAEAVEAAGGESVRQPPFDAVYRLKGRRGLFAKGEPDVRLLLKVVPIVDPEAVAQCWVPAARTVVDDETACLLLLGNGLSPAKELSSAISAQRHRSRKEGAVVVPIDMRDWEALFPPETPTVVRAILERLRAGR